MQINNPFVITGRIPDKYFCDRRKETEHIIRLLTNEGNLCIISPRRMGKSQLIRYCYGKPELSSCYLFYIDIMHTSSLREFTYVLGQRVFDILQSKGKKMRTILTQGLKSINAKFGFDPVSNAPTFSLELGDIAKPEFTLVEIFDVLEHADKPCIVAIDEFQQITRYPESNVEALLRSHIQHMANAHFVFSGSERHIVSEMFLSSARPFYNSTSLMELHPIAKSEYLPFASRCFSEFGKHINEEDVERVYDLFEGNTYYMQKTFHEAFSTLANGETCSLDHIRATIDAILEEEGNAYRQMLSRIPERQKELLYAVASEGKATKIMGTAFIKKYSLSSSSAVQTAARRLMDADLLTVGNGEYYIPDIMLRLYILRLKAPNLVLI